MNLLKTINGVPKVIDNGVEIGYEEILIAYRNYEWTFHVKTNGNWHDVIVSDDTTIIEI